MMLCYHIIIVMMSCYHIYSYDVMLLHSVMMSCYYIALWCNVTVYLWFYVNICNYYSHVNVHMIYLGHTDTLPRGSSDTSCHMAADAVAQNWPHSRHMSVFPNTYQRIEFFLRYKYEIPCRVYLHMLYQFEDD